MLGKNTFHVHGSKLYFVQSELLSLDSWSVWIVEFTHPCYVVSNSVGFVILRLLKCAMLH